MADPVMQQIMRKDLFTELSRMGMVEDVVRAARTVEADLIAFEGAEVGGSLLALSSTSPPSWSRRLRGRCGGR